ncbi:hypothetical protein CC2G_003139 [Coprinopsis cinerea AmutBmut pab1-1]|nr:hypothetical protein CC2G_003139 [Coprinopsis cinerea AmutBmut pab1-1]
MSLWLYQATFGMCLKQPLGASADGYEARFNGPQANEVQEANLGEDKDRQYGPESSHCCFELSAYARCIRTSPRAGKVLQVFRAQGRSGRAAPYLLAGLEGWIGEPDHGYSHGRNNSGLEPVYSKCPSCFHIRVR